MSDHQYLTVKLNANQTKHVVCKLSQCYSHMNHLTLYKSVESTSRWNFETLLQFYTDSFFSAAKTALPAFINKEIIVNS